MVLRYHITSPNIIFVSKIHFDAKSCDHTDKMHEATSCEQQVGDQYPNNAIQPLKFSDHSYALGWVMNDDADRTQSSAK